MVKNDDLRFAYIINVVTGCLFTLVVLPTLFFGVLTLRSFGQIDGSILVLIVAGLGLFLGVFAFSLTIAILRLRGVVRQDQRRRAAQAVGMQHRLALAGQPIPAVNGLALPAVIRLVPRTGMYIATGLFLAGTFVPQLAFLLVGQAPDSQNVEQFGVFAAFGVFGYFLLIFAIAAFVMLFTLRQRIEVYADGVTVKRVRGGGAVRWFDAQLFAIVRIDPWRTGPKFYTQYELSHAYLTMRFLRVGRRNPFLRPAGMTWDEYDRQMDTLAQMISAYAGLPLQDVR